MKIYRYLPSKKICEDDCDPYIASSFNIKDAATDTFDFYLAPPYIMTI